MMRRKLWILYCLVNMALVAEATQRGERDSAGKVEEVIRMPEFSREVPNITATLGKDVIIPCTVEHLMMYKVAWVQIDTQTILTIHRHVITRNRRIALLHNDPCSWDLVIKNVRLTDRGWYMCQINTDPMKSQAGYLDVVGPPDIIDHESSGDITIREGQDVTLTCRAKGHPRPVITWRRQDNQPIFPGQNSSEKSESVRDSTFPSRVSIVTAPPDNEPGKEDNDDGSGGVKELQGETLTLTKVSRLQMASYLCIASNGVPPSISKRAHLRVQFPPMSWVPQQLEGAYLGQELTIECHTEAFPMSINYWTNPKGNMVLSNERFKPMLAENSYKVYMKLKIWAVSPDDFGIFRCVAKNSLGETDGRIRIYEIDAPKSHENEDAAKREESLNQGNNDITTASMPPMYIANRGKYQNARKHKRINKLTNQQNNNKGNSYRSRVKVSASNRGSGGGRCAEPLSTFVFGSTLPFILLPSLPSLVPFFAPAFTRNIL